jgi:hypothetical protein
MPARFQPYKSNLIFVPVCHAFCLRVAKVVKLDEILHLNLPFTCSMRDLKAFIPSVGLFLLLNGLLVLFQGLLTRYGFSVRVLLFGNLFLFGLSLVSFLLQQKAARSASAQLFIRYFYISFLIKLVLVAVAALVYAKTAARVNRVSIIACMLLYLIYTFIEISMLLKAGKRKNA